MIHDSCNSWWFFARISLRPLTQLAQSIKPKNVARDCLNWDIRAHNTLNGVLSNKILMSEAIRIGTQRVFVSPLLYEYEISSTEQRQLNSSRLSRSSKKCIESVLKDYYHTCITNSIIRIVMCNWLDNARKLAKF